MACRCATVPRTDPLSSSLLWFFNLSSILFFSLSLSLFLVFQHLFASFVVLPFVHLSFTSYLFSRSSRNFSRHPSRFLHRDHSPTRQTGPLNLRPINLDKLNEWRPAFDARVNREYFSPPLLPLSAHLI